MTFQFEPLEGIIGARVTGIDPEAELTPADRERLNALFLEKGLLLFPGLGTSSDVQLRLSRVFGELEEHPIKAIHVEGFKELIFLRNKDDSTSPVYLRDGKPWIGWLPWHTDMIYTTAPCRGGMLRALQLPEHGGSTGWIDTAAAYDALDEATKKRIDDLEVRFTFRTDLREMKFGRPGRIERPEGAEDTMIDLGNWPDVVHRLVPRHPISGRRSLNVAPLYLDAVVGMDESESDALLGELVQHVLSPEFSYYHHWNIDDLVIWDNWRTMHSATGNPPGEKRLVHRSTLKGGAWQGRLAS